MAIKEAIRMPAADTVAYQVKQEGLNRASDGMALVGLAYDYDQIDAAHRDAVRMAAGNIKARLHRTQEDLLAIGEALVRVKDMLPHGQFQEWIETEFDLGYRTAKRMMDVARVFGPKEDRSSIAILSNTALYLLAAPSTPETVREIAIREAQQKGRSPTKKRIRQLLEGDLTPDLLIASEGEDGDSVVYEDDDSVVYQVKRRINNQTEIRPCTIAFSGQVPDEDQFVVYALIDPRVDQVYYVGATNNFERRMKEHCRTVVDQKLLSARKRDIYEAGEHTIAKVLATANDYEACRDLEDEYIDQYYGTVVNRNTPDAARVETEMHARAGEPVTKARAAEIINKHKDAPPPTPVREIEYSLRVWLDTVAGGETLLRDLIDQQIMHSRWLGLIDSLPQQSRKRDIMQALHNVLEQLQQQAAQPQPDPEPGQPRALDLRETELIMHPMGGWAYRRRLPEGGYIDSVSFETSEEAIAAARADVEAREKSADVPEKPQEPMPPKPAEKLSDDAITITLPRAIAEALHSHVQFGVAARYLATETRAAIRAVLGEALGEF